MSLITTVVLPSLQRQELHHIVEDGTVFLAFKVGGLTVYVHICEVTRPPVLLLRFFPEFYVGAEDPHVMRALLAVSRSSWLIKPGCDPEDGELIIDVELPLSYGHLSEAAFTTHLVESLFTVVELVPLLTRVRLGNLSPLDVTRWLRQSAADRPYGRHRSRAERQAEALISRLWSVDCDE